MHKDGIGDSIADLADDTARLVQLEIELFKQEVTELVKRNAMAIAMFAGAALSAFFALIMLQVWVVQVIPSHGWAAIAIVAVWIALAAGLAVFGKSRLKISLPEASINSVKESVEWVKHQIKPAPR
jgi:uncharacterized membrane protein YqjE